MYTISPIKFFLNDNQYFYIVVGYSKQTNYYILVSEIKEPTSNEEIISLKLFNKRFEEQEILRPSIITKDILRKEAKHLSFPSDFEITTKGQYIDEALNLISFSRKTSWGSFNFSAPGFIELFQDRPTEKQIIFLKDLICDHYKKINEGDRTEDFLAFLSRENNIINTKGGHMISITFIMISAGFMDTNIVVDDILKQLFFTLNYTFNTFPKPELLKETLLKSSSDTLDVAQA